MVAKTGYGVVEIGNSRDQNSQHEFQRFIFSMLSAAWYSLTDFFFFSAANSILEYTRLQDNQNALIALMDFKNFKSFSLLQV